MNIQNKVVFITGTNRGIGKSLVQAALAFGAKKVYATMRSLSQAPEFNDSRVVILQLDITKDDQIKKTTEQAKDTQILINNAGIINPGTILNTETEKMKNEMHVNYFSTINMMRAFVPVLEKNESSRIVNIASVAAYANFPFIAGYSASKAALYSATQAARIELAKKGIVVHAVNPGAIDTDMNKGSKMQMTNPDEVAVNILKQIEADNLDIVPDKIGNDLYAIWKEDPYKLEQFAAKMFYGEL